MLTTEMRAFLEAPRFAVLATSFPDGRIQQSVVWYALRDVPDQSGAGDQIILNTARGRVKDRNLRANPRLSLCWEDGYTFLTIEGTAVEIIDDQEIALEDIFALARRYHPEYDDDEIDRRYANFRREQRVTIVVSIDNVIAHGL
jgi:PPOX class probable F420-dependent enzyme